MFDNAFWRQYPYALPAFATATVAAFSAVISWTILEEVREHHTNGRLELRRSNRTASPDPGTQATSKGTETQYTAILRYHE